MYQNAYIFIYLTENILFLVSGRGLLGRWGPNHAGDPVVTRWAKDQHNGKQKVLEIVLINRKDNNDLALPGGMVDPGYSLIFIYLID